MLVKDLQKSKGLINKNLAFFYFKNEELNMLEYTLKDFKKIKDSNFLNREIMEIVNNDDGYKEVWII